MLYDEFINGTGCKDNAHNYQVYRNLEIMYVYSDMSKAEIYEYGKKLVDNSESEEVLKLRAEIKAKIKKINEEIKGYKQLISTREYYLKDETDEYLITVWKGEIKYYKEQIKQQRIEKRNLQWVLG